MRPGDVRRARDGGSQRGKSLKGKGMYVVNLIFSRRLEETRAGSDNRILRNEHKGFNNNQRVNLHSQVGDARVYIHERLS